MDRFKVKMESLRGKISHIVYTPDDIRIDKILFTSVFESVDSCVVLLSVLGQFADNEIFVKDHKTVSIYGKQYKVRLAIYDHKYPIAKRIKIKALAELVN
jgi:hypothetical protein